MGNELLPEERVLQAAGVTPGLVSQYTTELEMINDRQALLKWTGVKLIMDKQLNDVRDLWDEYEAARATDE